MLLDTGVGVVPRQPICPFFEFLKIIDFRRNTHSNRAKIYEIHKYSVLNTTLCAKVSFGDKCLYVVVDV